MRQSLHWAGRLLHRCHIRLEHLGKSAVAECSINQGHRILFHNAPIRKTSARYMDHVVREAIEALLHPSTWTRKMVSASVDYGSVLFALWKFWDVNSGQIICTAPILFPPPWVVCHLTFPLHSLHIVLCHHDNLPYKKSSITTACHPW
jgi:hypothetical protein